MIFNHTAQLSTQWSVVLFCNIPIYNRISYEDMLWASKFKSLFSKKRISHATLRYVHIWFHWPKQKPILCMVSFGYEIFLTRTIQLYLRNLCLQFCTILSAEFYPNPYRIVRSIVIFHNQCKLEVKKQSMCLKILLLRSSPEVLELDSKGKHIKTVTPLVVQMSHLFILTAQ